MDKEEEKGGLILILSPCLPLCFKHYITRDIGRNEGCSEEWRDGKNREEMEKANSGEKEVSSFFNPSSSSALIMSSLINSTAKQNLSFHDVVKTSESFARAPVP